MIDPQDRPCASRASIVRAVVCVVLLAGLLPMTALKGGGNDFGKAYYPDAKAILNTGTFAYTYAGVKNLPIVVALLTPFALPSRELGEIAFITVNQLAYVASFVLAVRAFARSARDVWVLVFLFVCSTHIWTCVRLGQTTPLTLFLLTLGLVLYTWRRPVLSGSALAWAFLFKIPAGLVWILILCRLDWRGMVGVVATGAGAIALSIALFGPELHGDYWNQVIAVNAGTTLLAANNQNVFALVTRYLHEPAFRDWTAVAIPGRLYVALIAAVFAWLLFLVTRVLAGRWGSMRDMRLDAGLLICTALISFPVSWDHYYLFTILPLYCAYERMVESARPWEWGALGIAFVAINLPEPARVSALWQPVALQLTIVSAPCLGSALLLGLLTRRRWLQIEKG